MCHVISTHLEAAANDGHALSEHIRVRGPYYAPAMRSPAIEKREECVVVVHTVSQKKECPGIMMVAWCWRSRENERVSQKKRGPCPAQRLTRNTSGVSSLPFATIQTRRTTIALFLFRFRFRFLDRAPA